MANTIAPKELQIAVRALIEKLEGSTYEAAKKLHVSREVLSRILAELPVREASITHIQSKLKG